MARGNDTVKTGTAIITRVFDAPVRVVWQAWTNIEHFKKWWGPKGFTCPFASIDLRVGGKIHACMRSADGQEIWSLGTFQEIIVNKKIVYTDSFADADGNVVPASRYGLPDNFPQGTISISFEEQNGKTTMILRHENLPLGEMTEMTQAGWNESFDKLTESVK
jgi:uncharacterized protein YndB with AHSA1/START domain